MIAGGGGDDELSGGEGNDVLDGCAGNDQIVGGDGDGSAPGSQGNNRPSLGGGSAVPVLAEGEFDSPMVRPFGMLFHNNETRFSLAPHIQRQVPVSDARRVLAQTHL